MSQLVTQRTVVKQSYDRYNENLNRDIGLFGTSTGHHTINLITSGWVPTKIVTIAGRSSSGKSGIVTQVLAEAGNVRDGRMTEVIMFSWEMHGSFMTDRYVAHRVGITLPELRNARVLPEATRKLILEAYREAAKHPVTFHHSSTNIDAVLATLDEWLAGVKKKTVMDGFVRQPLIILDYISMVTPNTKYGSKTYDLGDFLQKLKQWLNETNASALILAQINRSADQKETPEVSDLSDSQSIEQNSDVVILLDRPEHRRKETITDPELKAEIPSKGKALFRVAKNREGRPMDVLVNCDIARFRFWAIDQIFGEDYHELYKSAEFWQRTLAQ